MKKQLQLAFSLAILCLSQSVWAQKPDIKWFAKNPDADTFYIATADGLAGLAQLVNNTAGLGQAVDFKGKTIILTANINLSGYGAKYNDKKGWIPIGVGNDFSGTFDGDGKTISGLYISDASGNAGLFGKITDGEIKRVGVTNVSITASIRMEYGVGSIAGELSNSNITDCFSSGTINSSTKNDDFYRYPRSYTGGLVGKIINGKVTSSYSVTTIKGSFGAQVGGVAGYASDVEITNSYSTGTLSGNGSVGGLLGYIERPAVTCNVSITNSYSTGAISGKNGVGGVVGTGSYCNITITNSYSTGAISGENGVGGVAGYADEITNSYSTGTISGRDNVGGIAGTCKNVTNSYSIGSVSGKNSVGGVVGYATGEVNNNYSTATISGENNVGGIVGYSQGNIENNIALNPSVRSTGTFSRIVGSIEKESLSIEEISLSNNLAFNETLNNTGTALWLNKNTTEKNGADITKENIYADGTLAGMFMPEDGWVVENGKLPGLDKAVNMPKHLSLSAAKQAEIIQKQAADVSQITDLRDGKKYKIVKIGEQTWMAGNLNYEEEGKCYNNEPTNCQKYGRLYDWNTAMKVCPKGWHLPSKKEYIMLTDFVGGEETEGKHLKAKFGWKYNGNGLDSYGFSALPGGYGNPDSSFRYVGHYGYWWSASEYSRSHAYSHSIFYDYEYVSHSYNDKSGLFSVRCIMD